MAPLEPARRGGAMPPLMCSSLRRRRLFQRPLFDHAARRAHVQNRSSFIEYDKTIASFPRRGARLASLPALSNLPHRYRRIQNL
jgi:hypothetical protein